MTGDQGTTVRLTYRYVKTTAGGCHRYAVIRKVAHRPDVGDIYLRNVKEPHARIKVTLEF